MQAPVKREKTSSHLVRTPQNTPLKRKLCTSEMVDVLERDVEINIIQEFIRKCVSKKLPGAMFISGKPGTGKTVCVQQIFNQHRGDKFMRNCMSLADSGKSLYRDLLLQLNGLRTASTPRHLRSGALSASARSNRSLHDLERILTDKDEDMKLIILDEIDEIRDTEILRQIFCWPGLEGSRIILMGISNRLDLANHLSGDSTAKVKSTLHFAPYSVEQIKKILQDRIENAEDKSLICLDKIAIELCARKIAASSGDVRAALNFCKWGITEAEKQKRIRPAILSENGTVDRLEVNACHINLAFQEDSLSKSTTRLPLQQRVMICCGIMLHKEGKGFTVGMLTDKFRQIAPKINLSLSDGDISGIFELLVTAGIFCLKNKSKNTRQIEVYFGISEEKAEVELAGKPLMDSLLTSG